MRARIVVFLMILLSGIWVVCAEAKIARGGGGGMRSGVANRSAPSRANISRPDVNRQNIQRGTVDGNVNVNRNVDVNRNIDIDRNIDVDGWHRGFTYDDPDWGWGAFAAGATVGAIGAAAAYDEPHTVLAPYSGGYVTTLPAGCTTVLIGGVDVYDCNGVYYQPSYQGSSLMYQEVQP